MTRFRNDLPHHWLARRLQIRPPLALQLMRDGTLPAPTDEYRPNDRYRLQTFYQTDERLAVERCRPLFDTPIEPFLSALNQLSVGLYEGQLRGIYQREPPNKALLAFQHYNFGEDQNGFYPVAIERTPWRGFRVQVTRAELEEAGYAKIHAAHIQLKRATEPVFTYNKDPFHDVYYDGTVPLHRSRAEEEFTRLVRSDFLHALAELLAKRDLVGNLDAA